jgi:hypothetical protein
MNAQIAQAMKTNPVSDHPTRPGVHLPSRTSGTLGGLQRLSTSGEVLLERRGLGTVAHASFTYQPCRRIGVIISTTRRDATVPTFGRQWRSVSSCNRLRQPEPRPEEAPWRCLMASITDPDRLPMRQEKVTSTHARHRDEETKGSSPSRRSTCSGGGRRERSGCRSHRHHLRRDDQHDPGRARPERRRP